MRGQIFCLVVLFNCLFLTSCSTYQKRKLSFISPANISFNVPETLQVNKLRSNGTIVYLEKDSFVICQDYMNIKLQMRHFYKNKIHEYYFIHSNKDLIDHVILKYYQGELFEVSLITKGKSSVDSLCGNIELFYHKKFEFESNTSSNYKYGHFNEGKLSVSSWIYKDNFEAEFFYEKFKG
jgi:hypothetical protein